jgi:hypothetical protein
VKNFSPPTTAVANAADPFGSQLVECCLTDITDSQSCPR